jgi:hypothetical protein
VFAIEALCGDLISWIALCTVILLIHRISRKKKKGRTRMRVIFSAAMSVAAVIVLTLAMSAQTTAQGQAATTAVAQPEQVTVVGCVVRESDYRKSRDAGKGGVAGTGVGAGNEFVLTNASMAAGASGATVGTAGRAATAAYELTGSNEGQAEKFIGQRVEIAGKLKAAEVGAAGPTGGPTAGTPPSGVDVASTDLKLRELEVATVKATTGTCTAQ